jgi:hypothetical protein
MIRNAISSLTAAAYALIGLIVLFLILGAFIRYGQSHPGAFSHLADALVGKVMQFANWLATLGS